MTHAVKITLLFTLLSLIMTGCARRTAAIATEQQSSFEEMDAETERAFELERRADLVINYVWLDRIQLSTPGQSAQLAATYETLAAAIARATPKRELAVVIIGKPAKISLEYDY